MNIIELIYLMEGYEVFIVWCVKISRYKRVFKKNKTIIRLITEDDAVNKKTILK